MVDAMRCKKCGADLLRVCGRCARCEIGEPEECLFTGVRQHHPRDCAALAAANARIAELLDKIEMMDVDIVEYLKTLWNAEHERDDLRAQLAAARAELNQRAKAVGG